MTELDAINPVDSAFIDRIVDGTLTPVELRTAIDCLDRESDGWKRCALAFLEAQCWRESFPTIEEPATSLGTCRSLSLPSAARTRMGRSWIRGPIAAAIVTAAFATGWMSHATRMWSGAERNPIDHPGANLSPPVRGSQSAAASATNVDRPAQARLAAWQIREKQYIPTVKEVIRSVGRVHFGTESAGAEVPILAGPGITEQWLRDQPPPLNEHREVALQRHGYHVDQRRRLITTILADGRRVTVPIDQVQIRYTGNNPL